MCEGGGKKESCFLGGCCCSQPSAVHRLCQLGREDGAAQSPAPGRGCRGVNASHSLQGLQARLLFDGFMSASAAPWPGCVASSSSLEAVLVHQAKGM